jgi:hypothetical protein
MSQTTQEGYFAFVSKQFETLDARVSKGQKYRNIRWGVVTVDSVWYADGRIYVVFMTDVDKPLFWGKGSMQNEEIGIFVKNSIPYKTTSFAVNA